jgi:phage-related protein
MKGVLFGNKHSYYEWGLILQHKEIQAPEPKINQIEIEGRDGVLDLSEFFGEVKYKNRSLSFQFAKKEIMQDGFLALYSVVQNELHGKVMEVILDDDPSHFYKGRVTINEWKSEKNLGQIVIEVDAEPYKYKVAETVVTQAVTGTVDVILSNGRMKVAPTIDITGNVNLTYGTNYYALSEGRYVLPAVRLEEGNNIITLNGTGTAKFSYREGGL